METAYHGIKFCPQCHNMMCPKEDEKAHQLEMHCDKCSYIEKVPLLESDCCIHQQELQINPGELLLDPELCLDPTLPRIRKAICPKCQFGEAVMFTIPSLMSDSGMNIRFICGRYKDNKACGYTWDHLLGSST